MMIDAHVGSAGDERAKIAIKFMDMLHVDRSVIWNIPRGPGGIGRNNDTTARIVKEYPNRFIGFASVDPNARDESVMELSRAVKQLGLVGLKIHPIVSKIPINHPSVLAVIANAKDLDIPVVFHVESPDLHPYINQTQESTDESHPWAKSSFIDDVVAIYDSPKVWCAHMGGVTRKKLQESKVWFQTTGCKVETIEYAVRTVGAERVMYGSDYPSFSPFDEMAKVWRANLSDTARVKILGENVQNLLDL